MAGRVELGGEVREVAVLFVDLIGSTHLAATRPPTEVMERLNRFFAEVVDVVETHGGWINKFEGDAALAVFGAPTDHHDAACAALAAARALADRLDAEDVADPRRASGSRRARRWPGNIGDARRYEYTVDRRPGERGVAAVRPGQDRPRAGRRLRRRARARTSAAEARRWTVVGTRRLRGREVDTEIVVPSGPGGPRRTRITGSETTRSGVTRG